MFAFSHIFTTNEVSNEVTMLHLFITALFGTGKSSVFISHEQPQIMKYTAIKYDLLLL